MELTYISVKGWIIDPYVQCFFNSSAEVLVLPTNNVEVFNGDLKFILKEAIPSRAS